MACTSGRIVFRPNGGIYRDIPVFNTGARNACQGAVLPAPNKVFQNTGSPDPIGRYTEADPLPTRYGFPTMLPEQHRLSQVNYRTFPIAFIPSNRIIDTIVYPNQTNVELDL